MTDDTPSRITISRDALRADLAEMELRLRIYFDDQLKYKADVAPFLEATKKLDRLDRGEWTEVHRRALINLVEERAVRRDDRAWSTKERVMALVTAGVSLGSLMLSTIVASGKL